MAGSPTKNRGIFARLLGWMLVRRYYPLINLLLLAGLVVVGIIQAKITNKQATIYENQTSIMDKQREIADKQWTIMQGQLGEMQAEQRPWVYAKGGPVPGKVAFGQDGSVHISMLFDLTNVGHTPGQNVFPSLVAYLGDVNTTEARATVCRDAESIIHGITIFPGDAPIPWGTETSISKDKIDKATNTVAPTEHTNFITPLMVLCIAYRSSQGNAFHHSPYSCSLRMADGLKAVFLDHGDIKAADLRCLGYPLAKIVAAD